MHKTGMLHHNDIIQNIDDGYVMDESDAFCTSYSLPILILIIFILLGAMYLTPKGCRFFDQAVLILIIIQKSNLMDVMLIQ